jgi:hypothetical protein
VMNIAGGHHGLIAIGSRSTGDAVKHPPFTLIEVPALVFLSTLATTLRHCSRYSSIHSKALIGWNIEDVLLTPLFQVFWGFSSLFLLNYIDSR